MELPMVKMHVGSAPNGDIRTPSTPVLWEISNGGFIEASVDDEIVMVMEIADLVALTEGLKAGWLLDERNKTHYNS